MSRKKSLGPVSRSGGRWGEGFRDRFRSLIQASGSKAQFARDVRVHDRRITDWAANRLPNAASLYEIGKGTGVSIDWLLGFGVSKYRERARNDRELEQDVAAFIAQKVGAATGLTTSSLRVSGGEILRAAAEKEIAAFNSQLSMNKTISALVMRQWMTLKPGERPRTESQEWQQIHKQAMNTLRAVSATADEGHVTIGRPLSEEPSQ